jgi:hypothetical protein
MPLSREEFFNLTEKQINKLLEEQFKIRESAIKECTDKTLLLINLKLLTLKQAMNVIDLFCADVDGESTLCDDMKKSLIKALINQSK